MVARANAPNPEAEELKEALRREELLGPFAMKAEDLEDDPSLMSFREHQRQKEQGADHSRTGEDGGAGGASHHISPYQGVYTSGPCRIGDKGPQRGHSR